MESQQNTLLIALESFFPDRLDLVSKLQNNTGQSPHFGQVTETIKEEVGPEEFRRFIDFYINKVPENNKVIKEELTKLEREAFLLESKEKEKFESLGLKAPSLISRDDINTLTAGSHYCHSSLSSEMMEEFKNAKWVVLTSPLLNERKSTKSKDTNMLAGSTLPQSLMGQQMMPGLLNSNRQSTNGGSSSMTPAQVAAFAKLTNQPPQKRYGHSSCLVKNKMYVFGGLASQQKGGNLQTFYECQLKFGQAAEDTSANSGGNMIFMWDKIKAEAPRARDSHTFIHAGDALIMFGGSGGTNSFNDLYKFDLRGQKWSKLEPEGDLPAPREGHIGKLIGRDKMVVHGGVDQNETSFSDTYILTGISQFIDSSQISSIYAAYIPQSFEVPNFKTQATPEQSTYLGINEIGGNVSTDGIFPSSNPNSDSNQNQLIWNGQPNPATPGSSSYIPQVSTNFKTSGNTGPQKLKWFKCIDQGPIPQGRDSHSSALINNKLYVFGGQGDGDMIFDDLYSLEVIEELDPRGELQYIAKWVMIEQQTPHGQKPGFLKPRARTSHSCTVYKNRYMIIIGGEGEFDEAELAANPLKSKAKKAKVSKSQTNDDEICVDLDQESSYENVGDQGESKKANKLGDEDEEESKNDNKRPLNDIWVYDTLTNKWHEIHAPFKIQGSLLGKKIKKEFEPRMAHSAVSYNQFIVLFGGLSKDNQLVSNDLYVLSLDGNLGAIAQVFENDGVSTPSNQMRASNLMQNEHKYGNLERSVSATLPKSSTIKSSKGLKLTNPEDRKYMSGQILNQIINYNSGLTNQYFISGGTITNNIIGNTNSQQEKNSIQKNDCEVQTVGDHTDQNSLVLNSDLRFDSRSQLLAIIKSNDFKLSNFQRTKFSFIKSLADQIIWPIQCFGGLVDNSIEAFDISKQSQEQAKQNAGSYILGGTQVLQKSEQFLQIEINLCSSNEKYQNYIEFKDNGTGIHPKQMMEALSSFGQSSTGQKTKSDYQFSEHGVGLKLSCLRLAASTLIISKTKPVYDCGTSTFFLSIGLLSSEFMKKADSMNGYLVAPFVCLEIKNKRISKHLTPEPEHFLNMISQFTKAKFESGDRILQYALNVIGENGGTHIFMFSLVKHQFEKKGPYHLELHRNEDSDITLNSKVYPDYQSDKIESSLIKYLQLLYVEYPPWVKVTMNGTQVNLSNPYSNLKFHHPEAFEGEKTDRFALQLMNINQIKENISKSQDLLSSLSLQDNLIKVEETSNLESEKLLSTKIDASLSSMKALQGILIYRRNRLIRRLECIFGEELSNQGCQQNAIVSVFQSRSQTTLDKKDFSDKMIVKKVKEWFLSKQPSSKQ